MGDQLNHAQLLKIYPWITKELFEKCLRNDQPNVIVKDFTIKSALEKGENYASQMIRANIVFDNNENKFETTTIIMKTELKETAELFSEFNLLSNEIIVYKQILPQMHELLTSVNDYSRLSAKCFDCNTNPFYMTFEDLTASGYKTTNRSDGFDYQHFQCVLLKLAKWHATTAVLMEKNPSLFDSHMNPFLEDDNSSKSNTMFGIFKNILFACAEVVKHWNGYELIAEKLIRTAQTSLRRKAIRAYGRNDDEFNVLSHGDLWCNNIMFKETGDGNREDAIMVDFANCYWGSPANDLNYVLFSSSGSTVQEHEWDTLIMYYYENLITTLGKLKYDGIQPPTLTDINCDFVKKGLCAAILSIMLIALRKLENADDITLSVFVNDSQEYNLLRCRVIANPKCREELQHRLDYFNRKGYFD